MAPWIFFSALSTFLLLFTIPSFEQRPYVLGALGVVCIASAVGVWKRRRAHFAVLSISDKLGAKAASDISTVFGAGLAAKGSGTVGAIAALPFCWVMAGLDPYVRWGVLVALTAFTTWACHIYLRYETRALDPKEVVVDEFVGVALAIAFVPWTFVQVAAAFVMFRALDITKPWPISWVEQRLPGAWGVMFDDVLAGLIGGAMVLGASYAFR